MKNTALTLLVCCALLTACDNSKDTTSDEQARTQDETSSLASDAASLVNDATAKTADELDKALKSAKDAADSLAVNAKESADDVMDAAIELKDTAVESAGAAVETVKKKSSAAVEKPAEMIASVSNDDAKQGESIYKSKCFACHGTGVAGAPKLGDKAAWVARIEQGNAVLSKHAIKGFKGDKGYMPPKGGYMNLSDDDVSLAVQYMVTQAQ